MNSVNRFLIHQQVVTEVVLLSLKTASVGIVFQSAVGRLESLIKWGKDLFCLLKEKVLLPRLPKGH